MKCLIVQPIHADGLTMLRHAGIEPVLCPSPDMATVARLIPGCIAAITRDAGFSAEAFRAADQLRVVAVHGAGHDPVDKIAASAMGVVVCNTPGANARSVSELALALALGAARLIADADRSERAGIGGFRELHSFVELSGKTALIVGWGATGSGFGRMLGAALDMRVTVYSPHATDIGDFERVVSLHDGLAAADLVSLHTPLRAETENLLDAAAFAALKPGAILVNTARAGLVDEAALAAAIGSGRVRAAGLDVYSHGAPFGLLAATGRVIFTPHLGGATTEALRRVAICAVGHILTVLAGQRPATTLNEPVMTMR